MVKSTASAASQGPKYHAKKIANLFCCAFYKDSYRDDIKNADRDLGEAELQAVIKAKLSFQAVIKSAKTTGELLGSTGLQFVNDFSDFFGPILSSLDQVGC